MYFSIFLKIFNGLLFYLQNSGFFHWIVNFTFWYCSVTRLIFLYFLFSFSTCIKTKAIFWWLVYCHHIWWNKNTIKLYTKNIHHIPFRPNNKILYKFIVKTFIIYSLGKNTVIQWRTHFFLDNTMEKEYVQLYFSATIFLFIFQHVGHRPYLWNLFANSTLLFHQKWHDHWHYRLVSKTYILMDC